MKLALISFVSLIGCATAVGSGETDAAPPKSKDAGAPSTDSGVPKKDAGSSTTSEDSGTTTTDDSGPPPIDDTACAAQSTKGACEQCCLKVHPAGYGVYHTTLNDCICTSPAACATECATEACANQPTTSGDACETCINAALASTGACYNAVATSCQADTDCTALFGTCIPPCESK